MTHLERLEDTFFAEGPETLRYAALGFVFIGFVGGMAIVLNMEGGFDPRYLWFAGIGLIPGSLCWLLSIAVRARHIVTIPLVVLLCALSVRLLWVHPSEAASGISPYLPTLIGIWFVMVLEWMFICAAIAFMVWLWWKGAFSQSA